MADVGRALMERNAARLLRASAIQDIPLRAGLLLQVQDDMGRMVAAMALEMARWEGANPERDKNG